MQNSAVVPRKTAMLSSESNIAAPLSVAQNKIMTPQTRKLCNLTSSEAFANTYLVFHCVFTPSSQGLTIESANIRSIAPFFDNPVEGPPRAKKPIANKYWAVL
jgi:hypothetical protein